MEKPKVQPGDWITVGRDPAIDAVVCQLYHDPEFSKADIEVVYLDQRKRAINNGAKWNGEYWEFGDRDDYGGYADKYSRLREFVTILKRGRWRE